MFIVWQIKNLQKEYEIEKNMIFKFWLAIFQAPQLAVAHKVVLVASLQDIVVTISVLI